MALLANKDICKTCGYKREKGLFDLITKGWKFIGRARAKKATIGYVYKLSCPICGDIIMIVSNRLYSLGDIANIRCIDPLKKLI